MLSALLQYQSLMDSEDDFREKKDVSRENFSFLKTRVTRNSDTRLRLGEGIDLAENEPQTKNDYVGSNPSADSVRWTADLGLAVWTSNHQ